MFLISLLTFDFSVTGFVPGKQNLVVPFKLSSLCSQSGDVVAEEPSLALLTFDLDDTLFPVAQVVEDANNAMIRSLHEAGYLEATNDRIVQHTKAIRRKQRKKMTYTELRKRAIRTEMELLSGHEVANYDLVQTVYEDWLKERNASADRNLFSGALDMLEAITTKHPNVCIGAITNGRGNPLNMARLEAYFDFCVSGEDDGVFPERKPHCGIYKASLAEYHKRRPHSICRTRHIWCHVGDCLANDVGGSVKMGAYPIWCELDDLHLNRKAAGPPKWSTATTRETNSRKKLASAARGSVSERVTSLSAIPMAVENVLKKAYEKSFTGSHYR
jgi:putative hydrolase of the HAD superfamily